MKRQATGRDAQLTARMTVVLLLLAALYLAMAAGLMALYRADPTVPPYATVLAAAVILTAVLHYRAAGKLVLRTTRARVVDRETASDLVESLTRLAALADAPVPKLGVVHSSVANSLAVGLGGGDSVIVVTTALVDRLDRLEVEAVLAHELAHIVNHDARVMTLAGLPRTIGLVLIGTENPLTTLWFFIWPLGLPLWGLGTLLTLALSRYREFAADRGSALLTGHPQQLSSALLKLSEHEIPTTELRGVEALCIVPTTRRSRWLMDHPPLAARLEALERIARELGRPT